MLGVNVILVAADAVVANDAVLGINVIVVAADAVIATDDDCAQLLVPKYPTALFNELVYEDADTFPPTCNWVAGIILPIPTYPLEPEIENTLVRNDAPADNDAAGSRYIVRESINEPYPMVIIHPGLVVS